MGLKMFYWVWVKEWVQLFWRREDHLLMFWVNFLFACVVFPFYVYDFLFTKPYTIKYILEDF